ncbi:MAG: expansin EXLX1 family cellulose-binding protein [Gemmatimonadota bacterium]
MRSARYRPARANWIWLSTAGITVVVAALAALRLAPPAACPAGSRTAASSPAARPAGRPAAPAAAASPARPLAGLGGYRTWTGGQPRPGLPGTVYAGRALYYDPGTALGSCTLGPFPARGWYASLSPRQFAHGHACGTYLVVRGPSGTVRAEVVDLCPSCRATTVNLSRSAYDRIGNPRPGTAPVTYHWVADPRLRHPLGLRVSAPAPGELALQVVSHGNRLASVAITRAGPATPAWRRLRLDAHDFWIARGVASAGPFAVRIADVFGHQVILPRIMLIPGTMTRTATWLYPRRPGPPPPRGRPAPARRPTAGCAR